MVGLSDRPALQRCVPLSAAEFADGYWGRRPLFAPADTLPAGFDDLFSLAAADELLSRRGLRTPFIRVAKSGALVDPGRFTRSGGTGALVADQVADDRVLELFADGHTIVLQGLHRLWPPLIEFAGALTTELGHPVQVNAYITPSASQGFAAHYDVHDVFVLQIAGEKRWRIHDPVHVDPLRTQPWEAHRLEIEARAQEEPSLEVVLRPGDALYLPRGYLHAAEALGEVSAHLTVGIHSVTRHSLVEAIAALVADVPALRASLPLGVDVTRPDDLAEDLAATVDALVHRLGSLTSEQVSRSLGSRALSAGRPAPLEPLAQAEALAHLSLGSTLVGRRHLRHVLRREPDHVALELGDRTLRLPADAATAVATLLDGVPLRVDRLPDLDSVDALALARRLVREGVAVPTDESPVDGRLA